MILLSSTHVAAHDDITFFFWLRSILLCLLSTPPSVDTEDVSICSVQSLSCVRLFATPWTAARQASLSITNSGNLLKLMSVELVMPSSPLILLSSLSPPAFILSQHQGLFQWVSYSYQVAKVLELQLQHQSFQWIFRITFRMDWFDLLAVQGTLKSLFQHHSSKASILWRSALFILQLSHPYMTTGRTMALTRWTFAGKVMSLHFNMLSRLIIAFLPGSKCLNFMAAVTICSDFWAQEKSLSLFPLFPYQFSKKWWD